MDKKVIIVSNSRVVLERELGEKIDSFDTVIRINDFEIDGYEKHVGTKTDIWASCSGPPNQKGHPLMRISHWMDYQKNKLGPFREVWTVREEVGDNLFFDNKKQLQHFITDETKFRFMHKSHNGHQLRYVSEFIREHCNKLNPSSTGVVSPGTGFLTILTALEVFGEVFVYGNSFFKDDVSVKAKKGKSKLGKHYFTVDIGRYIGTEREKYFKTQLVRENGNYAILDYDTETKIIEDFVEQGRIKQLK